MVLKEADYDRVRGILSGVCSLTRDNRGKYKALIQTENYGSGN